MLLYSTSTYHPMASRLVPMNFFYPVQLFFGNFLKYVDFFKFMELVDEYSFWALVSRLLTYSYIIGKVIQLPFNWYITVSDQTINTDVVDYIPTIPP